MSARSCEEQALYSYLFESEEVSYFKIPLAIVTAQTYFSLFQDLRL